MDSNLESTVNNSPTKDLENKLASRIDQKDIKPTPSLKDELKEQIKNYPKNWVAYIKVLAPSIIVSTLGATFGPDVAHKLGYTSEFSQIATSYALGYGGGYTTAFAMEYLTNRKKYGSIFSKEFGKYAYTFFASDYVADLATFQPTFFAMNFGLKHYTGVDDSVRKMLAWGTAATVWASAMAGLHPVAKRVNDYLNQKISAAYHKIVKSNKNSSISSS